MFSMVMLVVIWILVWCVGGMCGCVDVMVLCCCVLLFLCNGGRLWLSILIICLVMRWLCFVWVLVWVWCFVVCLWVVWIWWRCWWCLMYVGCWVCWRWWLRSWKGCLMMWFVRLVMNSLLSRWLVVGWLLKLFCDVIGGCEGMDWGVCCGVDLFIFVCLMFMIDVVIFGICCYMMICVIVYYGIL